jgi:hypothetical protein
MVHYVCKVLDRDGGVLRIVPYVADSDRCATDHAILQQLVTRNAAGFQLWQSARLVLAFQNTRPAWRTNRRPRPEIKPKRRRAPEPLDA